MPCYIVSRLKISAPFCTDRGCVADQPQQLCHAESFRMVQSLEPSDALRLGFRDHRSPLAERQNGQDSEAVLKKGQFFGKKRVPKRGCLHK
jgi:hypothetical protein